MEYLGQLRDDLHDCDPDLYVTRVTSFSGWATLRNDELWWTVVEDSPDGFALFLAGSWADVNEEFREFSEYCLENGIFWISVWGPDCERMCDLFVEEETRLVATDEPVVMTTYHPRQPLHEAMSLFLMAFPDEGRQAGPPRIAVSFGERDWSGPLQRIVKRELAASAGISDL